MSERLNHLYEFGAFALDPEERLLSVRASGEQVPLTPKAFDTLLVLVEHRGHVLSKDELIQMIWPDSFVEENNLMQNISALRKALGEGGGGKFIETIPKHGYRFMAQVTEVTEATGRKIEEQISEGRVNGVDNGRSASPASADLTKRPTEIDSVAPETKELKSRPRWQTSWLALLLLLIVLGVGFYFAFVRAKATMTAPEPRTLAILPFRNLKPDVETDFLGFSLADAVITKLGYVGELTVRPSSYIEKYRQQMIDPVNVAHELNVNTLLTGSFIKEGDDLRITMQLIDVPTKNILWRDTLNVKYEKLLTVQDRVSQQIIKGLEVNLSAAEAARLGHDVPRNPLAYEYYLRGIDRYAAGEYALALEMLNKSVELDPSYAPAWAYLGTTYNANASFQFGGQDQYQKALAAYEKALALNPELIEARVFMANTFTDTNRIEQAVKLLRAALGAKPNHALAHWELGYAYRLGGMLKESIAECERARSLDPQVKLTSSALNSYLYIGEYERFLESLPPRDDAAFILFYRGLGNYYIGNRPEAAADFDRAYELDPAMLQTQIGKALSYAVAGQNDAGLKLLRETESKVEASGVSDAEAIYKIAQAYSVLGEREGALRVLRRSIEGGFFCYPYFINDSLLDNIRREPKFAVLMEQARRRHEEFKRAFF